MMMYEFVCNMRNDVDDKLYPIVSSKQRSYHTSYDIDENVSRYIISVQVRHTSTQFIQQLFQTYSQYRWHQSKFDKK